MEFKTNDLILRTVTENDIKEIARMWEYPHETTIDKAYEALKYMEDTHSENQPEKELREARAEKYGNIGWHRYHTGCPVKEGTL